MILVLLSTASEEKVLSGESSPANPTAAIASLTDSSPKMPGRAIPITLRAQTLAFLEAKTSVQLSKITRYTSLSKAMVYQIKKIAIERGYGPSICRERWPA
jgi:hypothetical protein